MVHKLRPKNNVFNACAGCMNAHDVNTMSTQVFVHVPFTCMFSVFLATVGGQSKHVKLVFHSIYKT